MPEELLHLLQERRHMFLRLWMHRLLEPRNHFIAPEEREDRLRADVQHKEQGMQLQEIELSQELLHLPPEWQEVLGCVSLWGVS